MMAENSKGLDGRRQCLQSDDFSTFPSTAHTGLWIDKYLPKQAKGLGEIKARHFEQTVRPVDSLYKTFYERWEKALEEGGVQTRRAKVLGRLAIGLGGESVLETAISLHHTYGVPYIPGSALKGLAAHYAHNRLGDAWKKDRKKGADDKPEINSYAILFGDTDIAGYVTFYDALYIPGTAKANKPLALDVMNVHHPEYYRGEKKPPADWDSPTPISFLSATGSYLIALGGPAEWVEAAFEILAHALEEEGIGAKTSSGYGRMRIDAGESLDYSDVAEEPYTLAKKRLLTERPSLGRYRGTVATVKDTYGFINPASGGSQVFVHSSQIRSGQSLREGQVVEYTIGKYKGRLQAQDVEILREPDK